MVNPVPGVRIPSSPPLNEGRDLYMSIDIKFRRLNRDDFKVLSLWMSQPHVKKWWKESTNIEDIEKRYGPAVDNENGVEVFIIENNSKPIGLIQRYRIEDSEEWKKTLRPTRTPSNGFGIDYFIGVLDLIGVGLGPQIIKEFVDKTWKRYPECPACVVTVSQNNKRSWRALEKAGFTKVWSGHLDSDDPSDSGPQYAYIKIRT